MSQPIGEILAAMEFGELDLDEGEIVMDAFVILRTVHPDRNTTQTCYTATSGLSDDPLRLGVLLIVSDRIRDCASDHWGDA